MTRSKKYFSDCDAVDEASGKAMQQGCSVQKNNAWKSSEDLQNVKSLKAKRKFKEGRSSP